MSIINPNNIINVDDSNIPENTPMVVIGDGVNTLSIPIMGKFTVNSTTSNIDFYECSSYTPDFAGGVQYRFTLTGAPDEQANGEYVSVKYVEEVDIYADGSFVTSKWVNPNGYKFVEECGYGEVLYYIYDASGNKIYGIDSPMYERSTNFNSDYWVDYDRWESVSLVFSNRLSSTLPPTTESWSGYKMEFISEDRIIISGSIDHQEIHGTYIFLNNSTDSGLTQAFFAKDGDLSKGYLRLVTADNDPTEIKVQIFLEMDARYTEETIKYDNSKTLLDNIDGYTFTDGNSVAVSKTSYWNKTATLKENMKVYALTPKVGEIYSADTSIRVRRMYDGAAYPITSEGLVFYAPLQSDYVDLVSGKAATVAGGTFITHNGVRCLELSGDYVRWVDNSNVPSGTEDYSLLLLVAPTSLSGWNVFFGLGKDGDIQNSIRAKSGSLQAWGGTSITAETWQTVVLTRSNGIAKSYLNGVLNGTSSDSSVVNGSISSPADVTAGAEYHGGDVSPGYYSVAAIYNRELSAEEVLEIHNTLMDM